MKGQVSRATRRVYPLTMICAVYRVARSSVYAVTPPPSSKPGPKTCHSDREVLEAIRAVLAACPFHGEGYRKVRARLAHRGLQLGGKRVLRLMRAHGLLAPRRLGPPNGDPAHAGTITTTMFGRRPGAPCSDTANTSVPWKEALQDTIRLYPSPGDCLRVHSKSLIVAALVMRTSNDRWTSPDPDDGFKEMDEKSGR